MINFFKKTYIPLILAVVLIGGIFLGKSLNKYPHKAYLSYYQPEKLTNILNYIEQRYVDTVAKSKLEEAAIPAMLEALDPHSVYIPASEMKRVSEDMRGNFEGIGVVFNHQTDTAIIISVVTGGPSDKVGVMAGDRIMKINGDMIAGIKIHSDTIVRRLKGEKGTKVKISVQRKGVNDLIDFEIIRDEIPLYSVDVAYMVDDSIGFIKINRFAETTYNEFITGVEKLKAQNLRKLILDLRGNTGGYMDAATNITDQFLDAGKLIVYTQGKSSPRYDIFSTSRGICKDIELVILQDEFSASASEIIAGAIQDNDRGTIIGRRSFGKGLVQEPYPLSDGSVIRLTIARYYTPTGRSIQKPYSEDKDEYYNDLYERYKHGEFSEKDSIQFADSLKFITPGGKIVFGGGGIMPDIFVPLDTVGYSKYYAEVVRKGILYNFTFEFADNHREILKKQKDAKGVDNYLESIKIFEQFAEYAEKKGVLKTTKGFNYSRNLVNTQIKANIARNIFDNEGFYPIIQNVDATLKAAIDYLQKN
ncbi:MAG TPA: S41 family peptidase [Bacteroidales bacterium]|nr:S41 family peptidase [Bacteroidales bacterium]